MKSRTIRDAVELVLDAERVMSDRNEPDCEFGFVFYRRKKFWLKLPGSKPVRLAKSKHIETFCAVVPQLVNPEFRLLDVICSELEISLS